MKVAYVLKMYPRFSETFIVNEILELERQGVDVRIYSLRKPDDGRFHASVARVKANVVYVPEYPDKEPERVDAARAQIGGQYPEALARVEAYALSRDHDYALKRLQQALVIAAHLEKNPVDTIHAHFASSAARVANTIFQLTGRSYSVTAHAKDIYHRAVRPESLRHKLGAAHFVATVSDFNRDYLQALLSGTGVDVRRLYNGIDLRRFRPPHRPRPDGNLILGVGRLVEKKGFETLIAACTLLDERGIPFRCEIIGKGPLQARLQALIAARGLNQQVRLVGPKPQHAVLRAYRRATLFALPCVVGSDGNRDGLPTVLLEAMATGLPVVSTRLVGIPEMINHDHSGLLVAPGDPIALADALATLLRSPEKRRQFSHAARARVEADFDVRQNVAQLHRWLKEWPARDDAAFHPRKTYINSPYAPVIDGECT
jgi:glycosyltransferase involved in cell wall biosynthesis